MSLGQGNKIEFFVTNKDRNISEDPLDWRVSFNTLIQELGASAFALQVDGCYFNNLIPTIMQGVNDAFSYTYTDVGGVTTIHTAFLQAGVYGIDDIIASLNAELQARNALFSVVFDYVQFKLLLNVPANVILTLTKPLNNPLAHESYNYQDANSRFLELVGWSYAHNASYPIYGGAAGFEWTPSNPVKLDGTSYIHICMDGNHASYTTGMKGHRPIACYPVTAGYGNLVAAQNFLEQAFTISGSSIQNGIRFYITDEWGMNLGKFVPVNMVFHFRFSLLPIV